MTSSEIQVHKICDRSIYNHPRVLFSMELPMDQREVLLRFLSEQAENSLLSVPL